MNNVIELNKLAEKITGTNPNATIDAKAVKFIADNYEGGNSGIDLHRLIIRFSPTTNVSGDKTEDEDIINTLNKIKEDFFSDDKIFKAELIQKVSNAVATNYRVCQNCAINYVDSKIEIMFGITVQLSNTNISSVNFFKNDNDDSWYARTVNKNIS